MIDPDALPTIHSVLDDLEQRDRRNWRIAWVALAISLFSLAVACRGCL